MKKHVLTRVAAGVTSLALLSGCAQGDASEEWNPEAIRAKLVSAGIACSALTLEGREIFDGAFTYECIEPKAASILVFPERDAMDKYLETASSQTSIVGANWVILTPNSAKAESIISKLGGRVLER